MPLTRHPDDPYTLSLEQLFERWASELVQLEAALGPPRARPDMPPNDAWRAEMRARSALLHPCAREIAIVYLERLDGEQRLRVQALLAASTWPRWQLDAVIADYFERALQSRARVDLDLALALVAMHGSRTSGPDFARKLHPFFVGLEQRGLDAAGIFRERLELAPTNDHDPSGGSRALFLRCAAVS